MERDRALQKHALLQFTEDLTQNRLARLGLILIQPVILQIQIMCFPLAFFPPGLRRAEKLSVSVFKHGRSS